MNLPSNKPLEKVLVAVDGSEDSPLAAGPRPICRITEAADFDGGVDEGTWA